MKQQKIDFIRAMFPDYLTINPYLDLRKMDEIRNSLLKSSFYTPRRGGVGVLEQTVINLVIEAQGKKLRRNTASKRTNI
jgi:hypothetical protein